MDLDFSATSTAEVVELENNGVPFHFYNIDKHKYETVEIAQGDIYVIINALADYRDLLTEYIKQCASNNPCIVPIWEIHIARCRKIQKKLEGEMGYDRDLAMAKCQKKKDREARRRDDGVGEEALVLLARKRADKSNPSKHSASSLQEKPSSSNLRGQISIFDL